MTKEQENHETAIVEAMAKAHTIADQLFSAQSNVYAVEEIYDYLEVAEDEEDFAEDLKRVVGHTKLVYKTETPTPEQVFGLFERIFEDEDEE